MSGFCAMLAAFPRWPPKSPEFVAIDSRHCIRRCAAYVFARFESRSTRLAHLELQPQLAANKFQTTARALAFVYELYEMGAEEVVIDNISDEIRPEEGGPYADSLIVHLPDDPRPLWELIERCERETEGEADGTCDERGDSLYLWWD
jgi:hypothetical protein